MLALVHHIGAKSGTQRITPLRVIDVDADTWLIAASKAGAPDHPAWYHNLLAHPQTRIEVPGATDADPNSTVEVTVTDLTGPTRDAAWARFTAASPGFREYEEMTARIIPVLELKRS